MQRYSKKRQAILDCLCSTTIHPTAEWIFDQLRPVYPDLSLATVYRNLNQMKQAGLVRSLGVVADRERFDGNTVPHAHAICRRCGRVSDFSGMTVAPEIMRCAEQATGFQIEEAEWRFVGLCADCTRAGAAN